MDEGMLNELQSNGTYSSFEVQYDNENDFKNGLLGPSQQKPILIKPIKKGH